MNDYLIQAIVKAIAYELDYTQALRLETIECDHSFYESAMFNPETFDFSQLTSMSICEKECGYGCWTHIITEKRQESSRRPLLRRGRGG